MHAALLALAVLLSRRPEPEPAADRPEAPVPARQVDLVYLQPPPAPEPAPPEPPAPQPERPPTPPPAQPTPPPRASTPPPVEAQPRSEENANAPPEAIRSQGTEEPDGDGGSPRAAAPSREAATLESEARRIFGRPRARTPPGAGPQAVRPMEAYIPDDPAKCTPRPVAPRDPDAPVEYGVVEGRILRGDTGRPLAGAHLQMLGTPYTAFTDDRGGYKFRFDLSLVDQCRTQYVRVTAKGYESRLLVLVVGPSVRSEDVRLQKRSWWR